MKRHFEKSLKDKKKDSEKKLLPVVKEADHTPRCKCGSPEVEEQPCPFNQELGDGDIDCNCCDSCRHECAMDI